MDNIYEKGDKMKLYEIPDYLYKKVRKDAWYKEDYIYFENGVWLWGRDANQYDLKVSTANLECWEEYKETKKIAQYRYTFRDTDGYIYTTSWANRDWQSHKKAMIAEPLKTETREIELD